MTTLGVLKARISDELARGSTLDSQIALAITDAIAFYEHERFSFNEEISELLPLVAGTVAYALPADFMHMDEVVYVDGSGQEIVSPIRWERFRELTYQPGTSRGEPEHYAIYADQIHFWPTPITADDYQLYYIKSLPALATDGDSNGWTTVAEQLIRAHSKAELFAHVIRSAEEAALQARIAEIQSKRLRSRTSRRRATGQVMATQF